MTSTTGDFAPGTEQRQCIPSDFATARPGTLQRRPSLSMIGLLVVAMVIGYEWFISGLVKFVRGDFPAGLAAEPVKKSAGTSKWYGAFLKAAVIPFAEVSVVLFRRFRRIGAGGVPPIPSPSEET